jgi:hypothetical protein
MAERGKNRTIKINEKICEMPDRVDTATEWIVMLFLEASFEGIKRVKIRSNENILSLNNEGRYATVILPAR